MKDNSIEAVKSDPKSPEPDKACMLCGSIDQRVQISPEIKIKGIVQPAQFQVQKMYLPCNPTLCNFYHKTLKRCKFDLMFEKSGIPADEPKGTPDK